MIIAVADQVDRVDGISYIIELGFPGVPLVTQLLAAASFILTILPDV